MELKFQSGKILIVGKGSFNRTFMELKFRSTVRELHLHTVLIVPLWN